MKQIFILIIELLILSEDIILGLFDCGIIIDSFRYIDILTAGEYICTLGTLLVVSYIITKCIIIILRLILTVLKLSSGEE